MLAAAGINSFKFFMAYKGIFQVSDEQMIAGFRRCKELGAIAQARCSLKLSSGARGRSRQELLHCGVPVSAGPCREWGCRRGGAATHVRCRDYRAGGPRNIKACHSRGDDRLCMLWCCHVA